jgi:LysM repeat protein
LLKFIIHTKRLTTAFFITTLVKPIIWFSQLIFSGLIVPLYRAYRAINKKIFGSHQVSIARGKITNLLMSRIMIHLALIALSLILVYSNIFLKQKIVSSDELVSKTKLASLISDGNSYQDKLIEDYPNLSIAKLQRNFKYGQDSLNSTTNILTKEQAPLAIADNAPRSSTIIYTIQEGDTISSIARRFKVSINTILWENDLKATSLIKPGKQLTILPVTGVAHVVNRGQTLGQIAKLYDIKEEDILKINDIKNPGQIIAGAKIIIPGGNKLATASSTNISRQVTSSAEKLKSIITKDRTSSAVIPTGGKMAWPTTGYRITQYYSWRHTGLDIADKIGTPIYAADSGTVQTVGYNRGGYGNQIVINHGGGKQTRYAHLSAFDVRVGQKVNKGQYIGAMGSTGRSTGPHLHFEVIINGSRYNPLNYIR